MSLTIPTAPQEAVTALAAALRQLTISPMVAARLPHAAAAIKRFATARAANPAAQPAISLGFFVLDLSDVPKGITAARQVAWRHLLPTGDPAGPALADTAIRSSGQHIFAALTESPFASDLEGRLAALGQDPTVSASSYKCGAAPGAGVQYNGDLAAGHRAQRRSVCARGAGPAAAHRRAPILDIAVPRRAAPRILRLGPLRRLV